MARKHQTQTVLRGRFLAQDLLGLLEVGRFILEQTLVNHHVFNMHSVITRPSPVMCAARCRCHFGAPKQEHVLCHYHRTCTGRHCILDIVILIITDNHGPCSEDWCV